MITRMALTALTATIPGVLLASESQLLPEAKALYEHRCGICHSVGGTGTLMLKRRLGPLDPVLAMRTDLSADLVKLIVRNGINSMPVFNRGEVTNAELELIAGYLTRAPESRATENK
jgi:mono/diheme cytochrome c family protein